MKLLKNIAVFVAFLLLAFVVVMCWEAVADVLPFGGAGSVVYGLGCVALFIVLFRKRGLLKHRIGTGSGVEEPEQADNECRARRLEEIRKSIRERKKQDGNLLI